MGPLRHPGGGVMLTQFLLLVGGVVAVSALRWLAGRWRR